MVWGVEAYQVPKHVATGAETSGPEGVLRVQDRLDGGGTDDNGAYTNGLTGRRKDYGSLECRGGRTNVVYQNAERMAMQVGQPGGEGCLNAAVDNRHRR